MPHLTPSTRAYLRTLLDDREAARQAHFAACRIMRKFSCTSQPGFEAADAEVNRTLDAWAAAEKRQENAFVDAGIYKLA